MVGFKRDMNSEMLNWFINHNDSMNIVNVLLSEGNLELANHLVYLVITLPQRREYTLFTAEQSVVIYEEVYSGDKCLRKAIDAWKKLMKEMSDKNSIAYDKELDKLQEAYGKYNNIIQAKKRYPGKDSIISAGTNAALSFLTHNESIAALMAADAAGYLSGDQYSKEYKEKRN